MESNKKLPPGLFRRAKHFHIVFDELLQVEFAFSTAAEKTAGVSD